MRRADAVVAISLLALCACHKTPAQAPRAQAQHAAAPRAQAAAGSAPTAGAPLPERAPGLWEQTVSTRGRTQVSRICLDKAVEQRFTWWGQHAGHGVCRQAEIAARAGGGWTFVSTCDMGKGGKASARGTVTGDFARRYQLSAESTISGANAPQMNGTHKMTLAAAWQGPCPAGMKPGDMVLPGGLKINVMQLPPH